MKNFDFILAVMKESKQNQFYLFYIKQKYKNPIKPYPTTIPNL